MTSRAQNSIGTALANDMLHSVCDIPYPEGRIATRVAPLVYA
jgi:hypothetical protein